MAQPVHAAKSNELLIHVKNEYDYRYIAPNFKNTLVNVIRKAINRQVQLGLRKEQCKIYQVNRSNLKPFVTLKNEGNAGIYRRPGPEFLVEDGMFEKNNEAQIGKELEQISAAESGAPTDQIKEDDGGKEDAEDARVDELAEAEWAKEEVEAVAVIDV
jgi:hypothetical protein